MSESTLETHCQESYYDAERAVAYIHNRGFRNVTENTLRHASYKTKKLAKPKVLGLVAHWSKTDLDSWIDSL